MSITTALGAEQLQWQVFQALFDDLNNEIATQETAGQALDMQFNALTGRNLTPVNIERVANQNFHMGHRPSLIEADPAEYPGIAVMAYAVGPSPIGMTDESEGRRLTCSIECICKSDMDRGRVNAPKVDHEEVVDRRIKRTAEAINTVMLGRFFDSFFNPDMPPTVTFGEVFKREGSSRQEMYYWQGVRFQYTYDKLLPYQ